MFLKRCDEASDVIALLPLVEIPGSNLIESLGDPSMLMGK